MTSDRKARLTEELEAIVAMTADNALKLKLIKEVETRFLKEINKEVETELKQVDAERAVLVKRLSDKFKADRAKRFADRGMGDIWRALSKGRPLKPHTQGAKRKSGAGRKSKLTAEQISQGIIILRGKGHMSVDAACETLREAGIKASDSALYRLIVGPAYGKKS